MRTPALKRLLGAYFHQDWFDEFPDENAAVDEFMRDEPEMTLQLRAEIDDLLDQLDEEQVQAHLDSIGNEYLPAEDLGYRGWLTQIADRVRSAATATGR